MTSKNAEYGPPPEGDAVSNMRCPKCGSTNASCTSDKRAHVHRCGDCGYTTEAAAVR